jgi:hypothetical protein
MIITVLAVSFLILVGFVVVVGYKTVIRRSSPTGEDPATEKCAICRERIAKDLMVERQILDYKLLYFCRRCILGLAKDIGITN